MRPFLLASVLCLLAASATAQRATIGDFGFAVVPEAKPFSEQFDIKGYPTTIVLNKQGQYIYDQEFTDNTARLEEAIRRGLQP